jgi:Ring finger domain
MLTVNLSPRTLHRFEQTAESKDLFFARNDPAIHKNDKDATPNEHASPTNEVDSEISDAEIDDDIESSRVSRNACKQVLCDESDEDAQLHLRLPVKDKQGNSRIVDGECAICFSAYEPDDKVVWSGLQCQHAFHADCILPWLANGKKRCPTCRQWFVPGAGTQIADQKHEFGGEHLQSEADASSSERTVETTQDDSQSHFENSTIAVGLGTPDNNDQPVQISLPIDILDMECGHASDVAPSTAMR